MRSAHHRHHCAATVIGLALTWLAGLGATAAETSFQEQAEHPVGLFPTGVTLADVDGDGLADVVAANGLSFDISVLLNLGGRSSRGTPSRH